MIADWAVLGAIAASCFSLGLFAGLGISLVRKSDLDRRIQSVEDILAKLNDDIANGEDDCTITIPTHSKATSLANIAGTYGCTVIVTSSGDAYATYGTGHC